MDPKHANNNKILISSGCHYQTVFTKLSPEQIGIIKWVLPNCHLTSWQYHYKLSLPNWHFQVGITKIALPSWHHQVGITKLACPSWYYQDCITKLASPSWHYQVGITKLALPSWHFQVGISKLGLLKCLYQIVITDLSLLSRHYQKPARLLISKLLTKYKTILSFHIFQPQDFFLS